MSLERRILAKVDRRLFSEMDHSEGVQLVKVPVSDAVWSTWRRYCDAAGVSMGRGLAMLLVHELASVVDEDLERLAAKLAEREAGVAAREAELTGREQDVKRRETEATVQEQRLASETAKVSHSRAPVPRSWTPPKQGRNELCWCGSGKKFKYCHGRPIQE